MKRFFTFVMTTLLMIGSGWMSAYAQSGTLSAGKYVIVTRRDIGKNFYYMTSDLGTASTKRYQAVDTQTADLTKIATQGLEDKYIWEVVEKGSTILLKNGDQYSTWSSGNSANFNSTGKELTVTSVSTANNSFTLSLSGRYLSMNMSNDYFAYYANTDQCEELFFIPCDVTVTPVSDITVRFKKPDNWTEIYLYAYLDDADAVGTCILDTWPGLKMENADEDGLLSYTFKDLAKVNLYISDGDVMATWRQPLTAEESTCYAYTGNDWDFEAVDCDRYTEEQIIVRFKKPDNWNTVYLYTWQGEGNNTTQPLGAWPGLALPEDNTQGWYSYSFEKSTTGVYFIFNDNGGTKTGNIYTEYSKCYEWDGSVEDTRVKAVDCPEAEFDIPVTNITLNESNLELVAEETYTLTATLEPVNAFNKKVLWSSSNPSVASVVDGVVTALAAGETTITATASSGLTASCAVTVRAAAAGDNFTVHESYSHYEKDELTLADVNGDSIKERFCVVWSKEEDYQKEDGTWGTTPSVGTAQWLNMQGEVDATYTIKLGEVDLDYLVYDFNSDEIPDILFWKTESYYYYHQIYSLPDNYRDFKIAYSTPSGYVVQDANLKLPDKVNIQKDMLALGDFNRDGKVDIFHYENANPSWSTTIYTPYLYLQMADGTFVRTPFPTVSDAAEINDALYNTGSSGYFSTSREPWNTPLSGFSSAKKPRRRAPAAVSSAMATSNTSAGSQANGWQILDMNQDGYLDVISEDGYSYLSLPNGKWYPAAIAGTVGVCDFNEDGVKDLVIFDAVTGQVDLWLSSPEGLVKSKLYNNANITHVLCEDMTADGHSDILLAAKTDTHGYMLFFKNDGTGSFKRTERALAGAYEFKGLHHFNASGIPTAVFRKEIDRVTEYKRVDWDSSFTLTEQPLAGEHDASTDVIEEYRAGKFYVGIDYNSQTIYLLSEETTSPQKGNAPNVIVDKTNGWVKAEWAIGTDAETSQYDLDYEVRVQNVGGTKTELLTRTAGNTSLIFDPTTWAQGDYIVQIRTIDKMNLQGEWSEGVAFTNAVQSMPFSLPEKEIYLADTLVATSHIAVNSMDIQALPDGEVIFNEKGVAHIIFKDLGDKTIVVRGENGTVTEHTVYVKPFKRGSGVDGEAYHGLFDYNQDGKLEGWKDGLYTIDKGVTTIYPSLNLSDVEWTSSTTSWIADNNHDGLPDVVGSKIMKNGIEQGVLYNMGDMDFDVQEAFVLDENGWLYDAADFDNDGLLDMAVILAQSVIRELVLYKNDGTSTLIRKAYIGLSENCLFDDLNCDGYIDIISYEEIAYSTYAWFIHINKGDFTFEKKALPDNCSVYKILDVNYDGYPDIYYSGSSNGINSYHAILGSQDVAFTETITLPGEPTSNDLDNDGRYDYIIGYDDTWGDSIMLDRIDGAVYTDYAEIYGLTGIRFDVDEDGYPDPIGTTGDYRTLTRFSNTAPAAPTHVYVSPSDSDVVVRWEGAIDKESHPSMLRYNLSVREKGTDYYVISPLNANNAEALTVYANATQYRAATRYPIPLNAFTLGKTYEICVQTIDPWFAHSEFSQVIEYTASELCINLPLKGGVGLPVAFSTNGGANTVVIADGGGVVSNGTITWNTAGPKTVTVIAGEEMATQTIRIVEKPDMTLSIPESILEGDKVIVDLPADLAGAEYEYTLTCDSKDVRIELLEGAKAAIYAPNNIEDGYYMNVLFTLNYQDPVFGEGVSEQTVKMHAKTTPALKMITVEDGGIRLYWDVEGLSSAYSGEVNIYRETTIADRYELLVTMPYSTGVYFDATAVPDVRSSRYVIALPTVYGTEGEQSAHHTSIHTMINQGVGNNVNLHWTHYEGAPVAQYTILSGTSPDNLSVLDNVSGNAQSYTHKRSSNVDAYYALAYTLKSAMAAPSIVHRAPAAALEGRSNVICSNEAYGVIPVESISLSTREGKVLLTNSQTQLHMVASITPLRATLARVAWSILSGSEYATIDADGTLTLTATETASGTITVQAKAVDGSEVTATMNIMFNYVASQDVAVAGIALSSTSLSLKVGDTHTLIATVLPENATNKGMRWSNTQPDVVNVEYGILTALAPGNATVTVTTIDGGFTATCEVTVEDVETGVENMAAEQDNHVHKVLENGIIYIIRNNQRYTIDGRKVE